MKTKGYGAGSRFAAVVSSFFVLASASSALAQGAPDPGAAGRPLAPGEVRPPVPPAAPPPPPAYAPPAPVAYVQAPVPSGPERAGFTIGFSGGFGSVSSSQGGDDLRGGQLSLHLGGALTPQLLLQGDLEAFSGEDDGAHLGLDFVGVTLTAFLGERFFLGGGLGSVGVSIEDARGREVGSDKAGGALLLLGVEVYQRPSFAISLAARAYGADFDGTTLTAGGLSVGFDWF